MTTPTSPPRHRGAPPGNTNALKHGFYSPRVRRTIETKYGSSDFTGLTDEITILRLLMRRISEMSRYSMDFNEVLNAAHVLSLASFGISRLMRPRLLPQARQDPGIAHPEL